MDFDVMTKKMQTNAGDAIQVKLEQIRELREMKATLKQEMRQVDELLEVANIEVCAAESDYRQRFGCDQYESTVMAM